VRIPLTLLAIFVAVLLAAGAMKEREPLKITVREERTAFNVTVTVFTVTPESRWLSLYGCSAEVYEHGTFCTGDFERESTQEVRHDQAQYPFLWRNMPRGTLQLTAVVFDQDGKRLAANQRTVFRGR
jgi:hypothetical protein